MIDLEKGRITVGKRDSRILRYEVWFSVPSLGLFDRLEDALAAAGQGRGEMMSVPVAVGEGDVYEILPT